MPLVITVDEIIITSWKVDTEKRSVLVKYDLMRDDDKPHLQDEVAIFWESIPVIEEPDGAPLPQPDNWYQLPAQYSQVLTDLTLDAKSALMHLIGE
jgi:hypothetical protein